MLLRIKIEGASKERARLSKPHASGHEQGAIGDIWQFYFSPGQGSERDGIQSNTLTVAAKVILKMQIVHKVVRI